MATCHVGVSRQHSVAVAVPAFTQHTHHARKQKPTGLFGRDSGHQAERAHLPSLANGMQESLP